MKAVITGVSGQDGRYLSELLLSKGYEVHGFLNKYHLETRGAAIKDLESMGPKLHLHALDLDNHLSVLRAFQTIAPTECYHLASPSFVSYSLGDELETFQKSFAMTHTVAATLFETAPKAKLYYAGSSEMFGDSETSPQDESTLFRPRSLYGIAKVAGFHLLRNYREREGRFVATGFLYNHESPRRGMAFVTRKITSTVAAISLGLEKELVLGNLDVRRDWGAAEEYVEAMWKMLQMPRPEDFVVATGELHSVRDFVEQAFHVVGLNAEKYVRVDQRFFRPTEKVPLVGNAGKARSQLGWVPRKKFGDLVKEMVLADVARLKGAAVP